LPYTNTRKGNEMRRYSIEAYTDNTFTDGHLNIEESEGGEWVKASDAIVEMPVSETDLLNKIADLMRERDALIDEKVKLVEKCQHKNTTIGKVYKMLEEADHYGMAEISSYIDERENFD